jgi:hypothetical protein
VDALKKLSLQDHEGANHDLHGVSDMINKTSDFVAKRLHGMQVQLEKLKLDNSVQSKATQLVETPTGRTFCKQPKMLSHVLESQRFSCNKQRVAACMIDSVL